ncbi:MAG: PilZ domain-containing protein [Myxococcota bacterium]
MSDERRDQDRRQHDWGHPIGGERRNIDRRSGMDRRSAPRVDIDLWIEQERGEETVFRLAGNLSAGGIFLEHGFSTPVGSRVKLRLALDDDAEPLELAAEVVETQIVDGAPNAASLTFVDLEGVSRERILAYLNAVEPGPTG